MYGVVCGVHQKEREQEEPQGDAPLHFFLQAFTVFQPAMQECKRLLFLTFRNKHWLQMNETVVRFNLVNT